jgi:hypothetical protein
MIMPTKHDYELAAARYMCMREEGSLSQLSEAQYLDNLKMIGLTWHGPREPAAELETVRDCEHPACKWQWGPFVDGIRGFEPGHGILDDGTGQPDVRLVCHSLEPVACPACEAPDALRSAAPPSGVTVTPLQYAVPIDAEELRHFTEKGPDLMAKRIEQLNEAAVREDRRRYQR